jgi:hypothetical protein
MRARICSSSGCDTKEKEFMRALGILQKKLEPAFSFMHAKRREAFWRAVGGLLAGQRLWLTALGRSLPGTCSDKHRIKAIDRLVGNAKLQSSVAEAYAALAGLMLRGIQRPVILVDWTGADPGFAVLSAKLAFRGRALTIFSRAFPKKLKCSPRAESEFLTDMATVIPVGCKPILVTDAGFLLKWFEAVRARGWDFVGRLRGTLTIKLEQDWKALPDVHELAAQRPRDLGRCLIGQKNEVPHRVVLSGRRKLKGRTKIGRNGAPRRSTADRQRRAAAREPWLLATSLSDSARLVVEAYARRMQIEETFRDLKSHRYGWSAEDIRSKNPRRIDVLLLIGAFAAIAMHVIGLAAAAMRLQHAFQANTVRCRPVFSTFFLGKLTIIRGYDQKFSHSIVLASFRHLKYLLADASADQSPGLHGGSTSP